MSLMQADAPLSSACGWLFTSSAGCLEVREMASLSCNYVAIADVQEALSTRGSDLQPPLHNGLQSATLDFKAWPWREETQGFCLSETMARRLPFSRSAGQGDSLLGLLADRFSMGARRNVFLFKCTDNKNVLR